jgi:plasmid stability protein
MATIQIRNVPDEVHRVYQVRAAAAGMSLRVYIRLELVRNAQLLTCRTCFGG